MLTANLAAFEFLPDEGTPFSIREWISRERQDGFLFLTSRGDQHASLRGLISTWLEIAVNAMLSLTQDDGRRIWVILDELPTLHQVPSLQPGLAESRQFGGCFVLGVQVASALRDLYGRNGAETISGLCGTRVVLAAPDRDTAQWSADSLGRSEVEEVTEGYSYGANTIRDGVSLTPRRELRALALPSEIMRLPNLEGYLKFPGPFPVASIKLNYVARSAAAERFVPRKEGADAKPGSGVAATPDDPPAPTGPGGPEPVPPDMPPEPTFLEDEADEPPAETGGQAKMDGNIEDRRAEDHDADKEGRPPESALKPDETAGHGEAPAVDAGTGAEPKGDEAADPAAKTGAGSPDGASESTSPPNEDSAMSDWF